MPNRRTFVRFINRQSDVGAAPVPVSDDEILVVERLALVTGKVPLFAVPVRCADCVGWAMVTDVRRTVERGREADYHCPTCSTVFTVRAAAIVTVDRRLASEIAALESNADPDLPRPRLIDDAPPPVPNFEPRRPRKLSAPGATWATPSGHLGAT